MKCDTCQYCTSTDDLTDHPVLVCNKKLYDKLKDVTVTGPDSIRCVLACVVEPVHTCDEIL